MASEVRTQVYLDAEDMSAFTLTGLVSVLTRRVRLGATGVELVGTPDAWRRLALLATEAAEEQHRHNAQAGYGDDGVRLGKSGGA